MPATVPVNAHDTSWKIASPKNFLSANITGPNVTYNPDGTLVINPDANEVAITGSARGLVVQTNQLLPALVVDVAAEEIVLRDSTSGLLYFAQNVDVQVNMPGTVGTPGALDTGAETLNAWYYIWLISNGTTVAGLFSLSPTAPTLPAGYTFKARVGAVRNDAAGNFIRFVNLDRDVAQDMQLIFTAKPPVANNTYEVLVGADLTTFRAAVPPIAKRCRGNAGGVSGEASIAVAACYPDGTANPNAIGAGVIIGASAGALLDGWACCGIFIVPVRGHNIQWKARIVGNNSRLAITGYSL